MEDKSVFISSCSRRQLARRRHGRTASRSHVVLTLLVVAIVAAAVFAARGGF